MPDVELRVPPDARYVGLVRLVVTTAARQSGMSNDRIEDLKIAVSEATANAMTAHSNDGRDRPVVLQFGPAGVDHFGVTIADAAVIQAAEDDIDAGDREWSAQGGLSLTLIRGLADVVDFDGGSGMSVHMRFAVDS
jgi:serine/threonine-protein kinase RsbW